MMPEDTVLFTTNLDGNNGPRDTQFQLSEKLDYGDETYNQLPQDELGQ